MEIDNAQGQVPATVPDKLRWLDALFAEEGLSMTAKAVAVRLFRHHHDETGQCNPQQDTIAVDIGRGVRSVNSAIGELRKAGWIEVYPRQKRADYVLVIGRAEAAGAGEVRRNSRARYAESDAAGTQKVAQQVRRKLRTEPPKRTTKGTTHLTTALAEPASELEVQDPAVVSAMPVQPVLTPPTPANDDAVSGVVEIAGLKIPGGTYREWEQTLTDFDLGSAILSRANWALGKPESRRWRSLQTELIKLNAIAREARISRKENQAADTAAGVERDAYGRPMTARKAGWIENPRAVPAGANPRMYMQPAPGQAIAYRGKGFELTEHDLEQLTIRCPALDLRAAVPAFESEIGTDESDHVANRLALAGYLDARQAEATARTA